MRKQTIPYRQASVAATFFEPTYQRLRLWHGGRFVNLLCFVHESQPALRGLLESQGASRSRSFQARCFAEVWELPCPDRAAGGSWAAECELDKHISEALGCLAGNYSAAVGTLLWGDIQEGPGKRRHVSRLLQESQARRPSR